MSYNGPIENILFNGGGAVHISAIDSNDQPIGGFYNIGTCDAASLAFAVSSIMQKDSQRGVNSTIAKIVTEKTGTLTLAVKNFSPENLALALFSSVDNLAAETTKTATFKAYKGRSIYTGDIINAVSSIVNEDEIPLTEGVDYIVSNSTIYIQKDSQLEDGDDITITYSTKEAKSIEGMIEGTKEVMIVFEGTNVANHDKAVTVTCFKVSLEPTSQRDLISAEAFASLNITGELLESRAVSGTGKSRMYKEVHEA